MDLIESTEREYLLSRGWRENDRHGLNRIANLGARGWWSCPRTDVLYTRAEAVQVQRRRDEE